MKKTKLGIILCILISLWFVQECAYSHVQSPLDAERIAGNKGYQEC